MIARIIVVTRTMTIRPDTRFMHVLNSFTHRILSPSGSVALMCLLSVLILLTGCGTAVSEHPTETSASPSRVESSDPGRDDAVMVSFMRSGGLAGETVTAVVSYNGRIIVDSGNGSPVEYQLTEEELQQLRNAVDAANLPEEEGNYRDPGLADGYQYSIISGGYSVSADETMVPLAVAPIVSMFERMISRAPASSASPS